MHTTTKKISGSATGVAAKLSRILRENGFPKATVRHDYYTSEGFVVGRVGYSGTIHVDYHIFETHRPGEDHARRWSKIAQMREVLFEFGYVSSHPRSIYIECTRR